MKKILTFRFAAVLALVVALGACEPQAREPVFEQAWIRAMPPAARMTSGYGVLRNGTAAPVTLQSYASPAFGEVSLHRTEQVDGMARMREVGPLTLQPGESLELQPGGYHFMLMMPTRPLEAGAGVPLEMTTADGRTFRFEVPVEAR
jgi:copper(I)-binding protein